jgi:hypothetical protein
MEVQAQAAAVIRKNGKKLKLVVVKGGQVIELEAPDISTPAKWCAYYGVTPKRGVAILFKALDENFEASHGMLYTPGSEPAAPDWDGGERECGRGLHFSPTPGHALEFAPEAKRFVACPVKLTSIVVHPDGTYPQKIKAPGVCGPVVEVDRLGNVIMAEGDAA